MSAVRGIGGREVPGAAPVNEMAAEQGDGKKKKKNKRGGKHRKKHVNAADPSEQNADVTAEVDGGSEDSVQGGVPLEKTPGVDGRSDSSVHEAIIIDKGTDASTSSLEDGFVNVHLKDRPVGVLDDIPISTEQLDDISVSTKQLLDEPIAQEDETATQDPVKLWLQSKTGHPYKTFTEDIRTKIVEHIANSMSEEYDPNWMRCIREYIWRAVVRSNYWWVNPDTGQATGKQKPVSVNEGVYAGNFEAFVYCCAERHDRIGRDLAPHEYVHKIEDDVRTFLVRAEKEGFQQQLEHLAFLLMFDETKRHAQILELHEMQLRIAMSFDGAGMDWKGLQYMKMGAKKSPPSGNVHPGIAELVWQDSMEEL